MAIVRILSLSLAAIAVPILGFSMDIEKTDQGPLCGGRPYARVSVPNGASPYVELTADGVTGPFLLDYGATRSSLSAASFSGRDGSIKTAAISLPGIERANFHLARYYLLLQPGKDNSGSSGTTSCPSLPSTGGQHCIPSARRCQPETLIARGFTPVAQNGFSLRTLPRAVHLPNVPVVFLRLGMFASGLQIDTGYEDFVYSARSTSTKPFEPLAVEKWRQSTGSKTSTSGHATDASTGRSTASGPPAPA